MDIKLWNALDTIERTKDDVIEYWRQTGDVEKYEKVKEHLATFTELLPDIRKSLRTGGTLDKELRDQILENADFAVELASRVER